MEFLSPNSLLLMEHTMGSLWTRQAAIHSNITNVETPGYKARYVTFEEELRSRILSEMGGRPSDLRAAVSDTTALVRETETESTRLDGNSVNATLEGIELSRTTFQLQYTMQAISSDLATLRAAIRGQ